MQIKIKSSLCAIFLFYWKDTFCIHNKINGFQNKVREVFCLFLAVCWYCVFHIISTNVWKRELEEIHVFILRIWFTTWKSLDFKRNVINNFYLHTNLKIVLTDDVDLFKKFCWHYDFFKNLSFFHWKICRKSITTQYLYRILAWLESSLQLLWDLITPWLWYHQIEKPSGQLEQFLQ